MSRAYTRIALLEHVGYGNLGDDATVAAVLHNIKLRWPQARITGITLNPTDTEKKHGIPSYAIRRECKNPPPPPSVGAAPEGGLKNKLRDVPVLGFLLRALKAVVIRAPRAFVQESLFLFESFRVTKSLDLLIICGGGQLRDSAGGPYTFTHSILKWVLLAKLRSARCYFLNLGAGPLKTRSARFFLRGALRLSDYTSFRDEKSNLLVRRSGFKGKAGVHTDCVYSLPVPEEKTSRRAHGSRRPVVGVSPMRVYWDNDPEVYAHLIRELGKFSAWLARDRHDLHLFSTELPSDYEPIDHLKDAITTEYADSSITCPETENIDSLLTRMSSMDYVVTCRFHGVVFAHLMNIPVLAISHHSKVATLMDDLGLSEYCLDINTFDLNQLKETFSRLTANAAEVKKRMAERAAHYRRELDFQFDSLFPQPDSHEHPRELLPLELSGLEKE